MSRKPLSLLLIILGYLACGVAHEVSAEVVVIVNSAQQQEELSGETLLRLFAMKKKFWSDGTPVTVFTLPNNNDTYKEFTNLYLKMQPHQLNRLWHRLVFSGTGVKPEVVDSMQAMLEKVAATPGAVGYVDRLQVDLNNPSVYPVAAHE
ncbi:hypothetical protein [Halioxenophilus sp. WMMB6]|uniref:hypothetical protein n=1 Tax=Halioxenophilus sp. WMMB6 TaxID=3073815 RepID=UPI00295EABCC|nr:hypothetical protein [Halioxenophilus sp. WMMB6]